MPRLGTQQSTIQTLNDGSSPCDQVTTTDNDANQTAMTTGSDAGATATDYWQKAKDSGWLPWAVAGGFALLWINKSN